VLRKKIGAILGMVEGMMDSVVLIVRETYPLSP